ncbi:hypothetical protein EJ04DRAFT_512519 [Polyplosphaeria fusca]|uniref:Copper acquisition factor BIM1-like domain-containing protein n=1 Tax=Polyplosphaeria fusca TaxID=682080 RepID=A0A9P4QV14_9PLEO|nr:hypothetical protein EJ04DRAFT_512519 [Polyplosphaeria fusca]
MFKILATALSFFSLVSAHFRLEYPEWRGDSFAGNRSQWNFPCAGVPETNDTSNRTQWTSTGGSIRIHASHPWALTYVNLGLGTNVSSFNISLVNKFNQTGNGTFCLKEAGKEALAAGLAKAGLDANSVSGQQGTLQVIQISSTGASLFNCADITLNSSAPLLEDSECANTTGVAGVPIENQGEAASGAPSGIRPTLIGAVITLGIAVAFL